MIMNAVLIAFFNIDHFNANKQTNKQVNVIDLDITKKKHIFRAFISVHNNTPLIKYFTHFRAFYIKKS